MGRQRGRSFSPSVFSCRSLCFFLPACLSLCGFTRQVSPFPLPLQKKKCGVGSGFCFGGGVGKAGGRGWKSGIPSGGDAQRWQLRENESNPSNPPPFQPPIRCFQKPHIFFSIYSDFFISFPCSLPPFYPHPPVSEPLLCFAAALLCTFIPAEDARTPGPPVRHKHPKTPPQNPTPAPQIPTFGDAGPQIPALGRQIWVRIIRNHLQVTSYL